VLLLGGRGIDNYLKTTDIGLQETVRLKAFQYGAGRLLDDNEIDARRD
jgi:hypothetical protein